MFRTPWWQTLLYYLFIWPIVEIFGFLFRNIRVGTSNFIQKITSIILMILVGGGIMSFVTMLANN